MYVTSARFSSTFLFPLPTWSRISSRNWVHPSPRVIRPLISTTITESTCRIVAFMLTLGSSFFWLATRTQVFHQGHLGPRTGEVLHAEFVHKCADQENPSAGNLQQIFQRQRVGEPAEIKPVSLIADANL